MADKIWLKRVLIPLWVVQILICIVFIAAAALVLWVTTSYSEDLDNTVEDVANASAAVYMAFAGITVVFDLVEMVLLCTRKLGPIVHVVFQTIKTLIWTIFLIFMIRAAVIGAVSGLTIFLSIAIFLVCLGQLIYGSRIMHRHRNGTLYRGSYSPAGHQAPFGGNAGMAPPAYPQTEYKAAGASADYYNPHHVQQSYEMHGSTRY